MPHAQPKRVLAPTELARLLDGLSPVATAPIEGGSYNTLHTATLADGTRVVVKIPPEPAAARLRYEHGILRGEVDFYRHAATVGVPVPSLIRVDLDGTSLPGGHVVMSEIPGIPWDSAKPADPGPLRRELGHHVARLHTVTGPGFGYPGEGTGPLAATWREAFAAMVDALLLDAAEYAVPLPLPLGEIRATMTGSLDLLDVVDLPVLVHFDLWNGNILLTEDGDGIAGLIDGERMFWGDPVADFVSLALFADIESDGDFLTGYAEAGGTIHFGPEVRRRLGLYRAYLYLLILVESVPRGYPEEEAAGLRAFIGPHLLAALAACVG